MEIASLFGGGMGRQGHVCGAVSGGLMVLGLRFGFITPSEKDSSYQKAGSFLKWFEEQHGAINCRDLLGHDISTLEGRQTVSERGISKNLCPGLVSSVVEKLEEYLL